jgi:hypothetical protein
MPVLRPKPKNASHQFWGQIGRNRRHRFWGQTGEKCLSGSEAKPLTNHPSGFESKPLTNRQPWFWCSTKKFTLLIFMCMVQTAYDVTRPHDRLVIEYPTCATIPDPLHQVSYSFHDPRHCPPWRTYHLHTMRQANVILRTKQGIVLPKRSEFEFKPRHVNDSSPIKPSYWPLGLSISSMMSPLTTKGTKFEVQI